MHSIDPLTLTHLFKQEAVACGFHSCRIARLGSEPDFPLFANWLQRGYQGNLHFLENHQQLRLNPRLLLEDARSAIVVAMSYHRSEKPDPVMARVSRYARGFDYHDILRERLGALITTVQKKARGTISFRICVDTVPLLERSLAARAGLGWIGRNHCLITEQFGSYVVLGELLVACELISDEPCSNLCGNCSRCLEACPTKALTDDGYLDAGRCLANLTIEYRGLFPREYQPFLASTVFGCDRCQECCPYNAQAAFSTVEDFKPQSLPKPAELISLSQAEIEQLQRFSPRSRTSWDHFLRNLIISMYYTEKDKLEEALPHLQTSSSHLIRATLHDLGF